MSRAVLTLRSSVDRAKAVDWIGKAPVGTRIEFRAAKRSVPQNDRMWAMLTDISQQLAWHGQKLRADDWKLVLLAGLKRELRIVPNIDGNGFVNLSQSSSDLSKAEMSEFIELIFAFGAQHGVKFQDDAEEAA